jgi:hypothetical protein
VGHYPTNIIDVRDIQDIEDEYQNKISHFLIKLRDYQVHLKCDNYDEKNQWIKAIGFMREKFKASCFFSERKYKEDIQDEMKLQIYSENEQRNWEQAKVGGITNHRNR